MSPGTYVRTSAIDLLVDKFLTTDPASPKQIVSLGAGTDTRYFRLRDAYPGATVVYHEIDFPANTAAKLSSIRRHPQLLTKLASSSDDQSPVLPPTANSYDSATYNLHALDLRSLASTEDGSPTTLPNLDPSTPTLILSEMCLIYLQPETVSDILAALVGKHIPAPTPVSLILYEPILPQDAFGRTMISNLSTRNIHLPTLTAYPGLSDQRQRLRKYGFENGFRAADTRFIWHEWVGEAEKARVAGLEMLDEHEELDLLLKHYCVAWGWRDGPGDVVFTNAWGQVREQDKG